MDESELDQKVQEHFRQIAENATKLAQPFVIGIYAPRFGHKGGVDQVGTGFLLRHAGRTVFVTAKHVLYGHSFDENPGDKLIIAQGALTPIGDLGIGEVCKANDHDLACMIVDDLKDASAVSMDQLAGGDHQAREVTIYGYLAKGLRIDKPNGVLMPDARCYTCTAKDQGQGFIGMKFSWRKFRESNTGEVVKAARPEGLSGGPMLDGDVLAAGELKLLGVFTDYKQSSGYAFGESIDKVKAMVAWIAEKSM